MDEQAPPSREAWVKALGELFSTPRIRDHAHFRYRIDEPTEADQAFDTIFESALGPNWNKKHQRWVRRLRRLGLIGPRLAGR
jgi:hypothetical protein